MVDMQFTQGKNVSYVRRNKVARGVIRRRRSTSPFCGEAVDTKARQPMRRVLDSFPDFQPEWREGGHNLQGYIS